MTLFRSKRPSTDEICLNTCNEYQGGGEGGDISDSNMAEEAGPYKRTNRRHRRHRTDSESAKLLRDKSADRT